MLAELIQAVPLWTSGLLKPCHPLQPAGVFSLLLRKNYPLKGNLKKKRTKQSIAMRYGRMPYKIYSTVHTISKLSGVIFLKFSPCSPHTCWTGKTAC